MLTQRQQDTLDFIEGYIEQYGEAPLVSEIADALGIKSQGTTHRYIDALVGAGYIKRLKGRTRGIAFIGTQIKSSGAVVLPVKGKIAAGRLIEAVSDESEIDLGQMFHGKGRYVLKITGESMIDKGLLPGDYVVIDGNRQATHGDMVVALVDGYDATLKTLLLNDDKTVTLMPANEEFEPVTLAPERLNVQGVVVGQMRTYP